MFLCAIIHGKLKKIYQQNYILRSTHNQHKKQNMNNLERTHQPHTLNDSTMAHTRQKQNISIGKQIKATISALKL